MKTRLLIFSFLLLAGMNMTAQDIIDLPVPDKNVPMPLFEALDQRKSVREYSEKVLDKQVLSQLLWAASGVNREDGRMTAPTAINARDISIYVLTKDGASLYLPKEHALKTVSNKDLRPSVANSQASIASAPVILLLVSDTGKFRKNMDALVYGSEDAAYVSQNINLAAVALGLATVPRARMDKEALRKELSLTDKQVPILNNPVGYPQ